MVPSVLVQQLHRGASQRGLRGFHRRECRQEGGGRKGSICASLDTEEGGQLDASGGVQLDASGGGQLDASGGGRAPQSLRPHPLFISPFQLYEDQCHECLAVVPNQGKRDHVWNEHLHTTAICPVLGCSFTVTSNFAMVSGTLGTHVVSIFHPRPALLTFGF